MSISTRYLATKKKIFLFLKTLEKKTCPQMFLFYVAYFSKQNRDQMKERNQTKKKKIWHDKQNKKQVTSHGLEI